MRDPIHEAGFTCLFNAAPDAMLIADRSGSIVAANRRAAQLFEIPAAELTGLTIEDLVPDRFRPDHPQKRERYHHEAALRQMGSGLRAQALRRSGTEFPAEILLSPLQDDSCGAVLVVIRDLSEHHEAEERLFRERERALVTLTSVADAVITTDLAGLVDFLNPAAEQLTGWQADAALGRPLDEVLRLVAEVSGAAVESPVTLCLRMGRTSPDEALSLQRPDGSLLPVAYTVAPITDRAGATTGIVVAFRDVREQRRVARQLSHEATHDSLTGLVNRAEFERRLARTVLASGEGTPATLCYLDLDRFKVVNDSCGHQAGDEVLRQVATIMGGVCRQRDTLARLGGDEFAVLLDNCTIGEGIRVAGKIQRSVASHRFTWHDRSFYLGISAGVAAVTPDSAPEALLLAADAACYTSKAGGGVRVEVARPEEGELTDDEDRRSREITRMVQPVPVMPAPPLTI